MNESPEILFERRGRAGIITLDRPAALNALTRDMVGQMHPQLALWASDPRIELVIIRAAGDKAFCAGGDIRQLHDWGKAGDPAILEFYREEYRLNTFIKRYPKPFVALVDGIVMGGGVGISIHGSHRVAGPRTLFAMPETGIGLFPDVGGTYFLPRLPGKIGTWLALTGARLGQADMLWCGLATHALASQDFNALTDELALGGQSVDAVLAGRHVAPHDAPTLPELQRVIDRCFAGATVEAIVDALRSEDGAHREWAVKQAETIARKSPTSLKIALRQMAEGTETDFETCMKIEFRIVSRIVQGHEFFEGVRAVILDKDNAPRWVPSTLAEVDDRQVDAYFAPLSEELDLTHP